MTTDEMLRIKEKERQRGRMSESDVRYCFYNNGQAARTENLKTIGSFTCNLRLHRIHVNAKLCA